ncbi:hypothetical protein SBOR_6562 [Sclerotinia borealis F-4128]|uniref:Uncharacterized protein n=1 Tax=Sclerotinia borealis (strain F-4128) TaxID=1432307 RepID=W9CB16_SCLBF|nr:hypothetical protein SBOR_6562 [Sclerotinia borealis F-4128]
MCIETRYRYLGCGHGYSRGDLGLRLRSSPRLGFGGGGTSGIIFCKRGLNGKLNGKRVLDMGYVGREEDVQGEGDVVGDVEEGVVEDVVGERREWEWKWEELQMIQMIQRVWWIGCARKKGRVRYWGGVCGVCEGVDVDVGMARKETGGKLCGLEGRMRNRGVMWRGNRGGRNRGGGMGRSARFKGKRGNGTENVNYRVEKEWRGRYWEKWWMIPTYSGGV